MGPATGLDKLVWPFKRNGSFLVKSGYRWCYNRHLTVNLNRNSSSQSIDPWVWDWVWSCKALPNLRNFLWRAFHDACATKLNLYRRRCAISPLCPICAKRDETVEHILMLCPWASRVWKEGRLHLQIDRCSIITLGDWLCSVVNQNLRYKVDLNRSLAYLVFLCWFI